MTTETGWLRPMAIARNRLQSAMGKRLKRFMLAAIVAVAASQVTLTLCLGIFRINATTSGLAAWFAGAASSYIMSRWTWERKGRPHLLKETLPFWAIAACVAVVLTSTSKFANDFALSQSFGHTRRILFVDVAYFLANCFTFLTRFFIFHYILFVERKPRPDAPAAKTDRA